MEAKFYEMLKAASTFDNWSKITYFSKLHNLLLEKEIELAQRPQPPSNRITELLYHKAELERDILKAELEDIINKFDNPLPPSSTSLQESKIRIVRKSPAHNS